MKVLLLLFQKIAPMQSMSPVGCCHVSLFGIFRILVHMHCMEEACNRIDIYGHHANVMRKMLLGILPRDAL